MPVSIRDLTAARGLRTLGIVLVLWMAVPGAVVDAQLGRGGRGFNQGPSLAPIDRDLADTLFRLYDAGDFAEFDRRLTGLASLPINWFEFEADAGAWIAAAPVPERGRVVAAAVALELAHAEPESSQWGRILIELGCRLLHEQPPSAIERSWHAAVLAFGESRDLQMLMARAPGGGRTSQVQELQAVLRSVRGRARRAAMPSRLDDLTPWPGHALHTAARFPDEPRVALLPALQIERLLLEPSRETLLTNDDSPVWVDAAAVSRIVAAGRKQILAMPENQRMDRASAEAIFRAMPELNQGFPATAFSLQPLHPARMSWLLWDTAEAFAKLGDRKGIASEANLRLGQTLVRLGLRREAIEAFRKAEAAATTRHELYLSRTLGGAALESLGQHTAAIAAFRGALDAVPRAQSATLALAPLLFASGELNDAADLLDAAVRYPLVDPLQDYWKGDPAAWSRAIGQLRRALAAKAG